MPATWEHLTPKPSDSKVVSGAKRSNLGPLQTVRLIDRSRGSNG